MKLAAPTRHSSVESTPVERMPWYDLALLAASGVGVLAALYLAFVYAPTEATQGNVQRIFYFHVPIAWLMEVSFFIVFATSILFLWKRDERWDIYARCSAELGVVFTTLVLITGSLWGRPIWGAWWAWDARMTTTLILWAIYVVYLMLRSYSADQARGARYAAVLGIIGFFDVPLIHLSVILWRTLHPGMVISLEGESNLPPEMLNALMVSFVAFSIFFVFLLRQRIKLEWLKVDVQRARDERE